MLIRDRIQMTTTVSTQFEGVSQVLIRATLHACDINGHTPSVSSSLSPQKRATCRNIGSVLIKAERRCANERHRLHVKSFVI